MKKLHKSNIFVFGKIFEFWNFGIFSKEIIVFVLELLRLEIKLYFKNTARTVFNIDHSLIKSMSDREPISDFLWALASPQSASSNQ